VHTHINGEENTIYENRAETNITD